MPLPLAPEVVVEDEDASSSYPSFLNPGMRGCKMLIRYNDIKSARRFGVANAFMRAEEEEESRVRGKAEAEK